MFEDPLSVQIHLHNHVAFEGGPKLAVKVELSVRHPRHFLHLSVCLEVWICADRFRVTGVRVGITCCYVNYFTLLNWTFISCQASINGTDCVHLVFFGFAHGSIYTSEKSNILNILLVLWVFPRALLLVPSNFREMWLDKYDKRTSPSFAKPYFNPDKMSQISHSKNVLIRLTSKLNHINESRELYVSH